MTVRLGILGTAQIAPSAVIAPSRGLEGVEVRGVASRSQDRAQSFATNHRLAAAYGSYEALLADPQIDAVYIALPNGLHHEWTTRALEANKHVLCEKPLANNAREAAELAETAKKQDRVLLEACHHLFHPMTHLAESIIAEGRLGQLRHVDCKMMLPFFVAPKHTDIRYDLQLGGGATMDLGVYPVSLLRRILPSPPVVSYAEAELASPGVDHTMRAELQHHDRETGRRISAHIEVAFSSGLGALQVEVHGDAGILRLNNPYLPHLLGAATLRVGKKKEKLPFDKAPSSYQHQLAAFRDAILQGAPLRHTVEDARDNLETLDSIYRRAGLEPRGT